MSPKKRNSENRPYPTNWRVRQRGAKWYILYRVPKSDAHLWDNKREFTLAKADTLKKAEKEAYDTWAKRFTLANVADRAPLTMGEALDRYELEVVPGKSFATRKSNGYSLRRLRAVIDRDMPVTEFRTFHAYQYRDACARDQSPKKANLDIEVLGHLFTKCLEWGVPGLQEHPITGKIQKISIPPRDRYVEDWELAEFLSVATDRQKVYVPLKYALGIDKGMVLRIQLPDIQADRLIIHKRAKIKKNAKAKKKAYLFQHEGESTGLKELLDAVLAWRAEVIGARISPFLFCTSDGTPLIDEDGETSTFDSEWQRTMKRALKLTKLEARFTEHDLCAKTSSDADTTEEAAKLRGHLNTATTEKVYRRKPQNVVPMNRKG